MLETLYDIFSAPNVEPLESTRMGLPAHLRGHKCSTCVCLDHAPLIHLSFVETAHLCKARSPGRTQYYNLLFDSSCHSVDSLYLVSSSSSSRSYPGWLAYNWHFKGGLLFSYTCCSAHRRILILHVLLKFNSNPSQTRARVTRPTLVY